MIRIKKISYWFSLILFSLVAAYLVCPYVFSFTNINWLVDDDLAQTLIGWEFYRVSLNMVPITQIVNLFPDSGFYILQTDTMPWISILTKLLVQHMNIKVPFHFIGLWLIFCWVMQGMYAGIIGNFLKLKKDTAWLLVFLFVFSPVLLFRFGHLSLMAHWIILAVLYEVIRLNAGEVISTSRILYLVSIVALSLGIHPYLFAISAPILILLILLNRTHILKKIFQGLFLFLLIYFSTYILSVHSIKNPKAADFGACNTDLLGIFNSFGASKFIPKLRHFWCQPEGFMYFGIAFLLLLFILRRPLKALFFTAWKSKPHKYFLLLCGLYILYSLASPIRFGGNPIIYLPIYELLEPLPSYFRSSGRWIWPFFYAIVIAGVFVLDRTHIAYKKGAILAIVLCHFVEFTPLMRIFKAPPQGVDLEIERIIAQLPRPSSTYKKMLLYPNVVSVACGIDDNKWDYRTYALVMIALARTGWQVDSGLGGRFDPDLVAQCHEYNKKAPNFQFPMITRVLPSKNVSTVELLPNVYLIKDDMQK